MGKLNDLGSDAETTLHLWAAKIKITILKAGFLQSIGLIGNYERRVLGLVFKFKLSISQHLEKNAAKESSDKPAWIVTA